ncbi:MAG TPA: hypothetical protein DCM62_06600 [Bacteroidales bacterium]|nr:hypothetical protein [Bacteroidales bacterium]
MPIHLLEVVRWRLVPFETSLNSVIPSLRADKPLSMIILDVHDVIPPEGKDLLYSGIVNSA